MVNKFVLVAALMSLLAAIYVWTPRPNDNTACEKVPWPEEMKVTLLNHLDEYSLIPGGPPASKSEIMRAGVWQLIENSEFGENLLGSEQFRFRYELRLTFGIKKYFGSFDVCGALRQFGPLPR